MASDRIKAPDHGHGLAECSRLGDHGNCDRAQGGRQRDTGLDLALDFQAHNARTGEDGSRCLAAGGDKSTETAKPRRDKVGQGRRELRPLSEIHPLTSIDRYDEIVP